MMRLILLLTLTLTFITAQCAGAPSRTPCASPGVWLDASTATPTPIDGSALFARMARQQAVLLGESHDSAEDHRWQLHALARLHALQPQMAIGFEMFPRRLQPVLDEWVAGKLSEREFLQRAEWDKVWGYDARDYLPLFHFARMQRLPMLALNIERELIEAVRLQGWDALPVERREGVTLPAAPNEAYRQRLREVFEHHPDREHDNPAAFERFVLTQTLWDRAMAEGIATHLERQPAALVVAILGAGHVRHGHGVTHQLQALGIQRSGTLLTWPHEESCSSIPAGIADAVQVVAAPTEQPQRIGVYIAPAGHEPADGLKISKVAPDSIAAQAGLLAGDVILSAAGRPTDDIRTLRGIVQHQTPGTWLPLKVKRGTEEIEIIARFPVAP